MNYLEGVSPEVLEELRAAFSDGVLLDDLQEMPSDGGVISDITAKFVIIASNEHAD